MKKEIRKQTPHNTTVEIGFYSNDIEGQLSQIETSADRVIKKIISKEYITSSDKKDLSKFIGFQITRTKYFQRISNDVNKLLEEKLYKPSSWNKEKEKQYKRIFERDPNIKAQADKYLEMLKDKTPEAIDLREHRLRFLVVLGEYFSEHFYNCSWNVLYSKEEFVTCDNPLLIVARTKHSGITAKLDDVDVLKFIPLSKTIGIKMLGNDGKMEFNSVEDAFAKEINKIMYIFSERFLISSREDLSKTIITQMHGVRGRGL